MLLLNANTPLYCKFRQTLDRHTPGSQTPDRQTLDGCQWGTHVKIPFMHKTKEGTK